MRPIHLTVVNWTTLVHRNLTVRLHPAVKRNQSPTPVPGKKSRKSWAQRGKLRKTCQCQAEQERSKIEIHRNRCVPAQLKCLELAVRNVTGRMFKAVNWKPFWRKIGSSDSPVIFFHVYAKELCRRWPKSWVIAKGLDDTRWFYSCGTRRNETVDIPGAAAFKWMKFGMRGARAENGLRHGQSQ